MRRAIEIARLTAMIDHAGGPFGCVVVRDEAVVAEGANRVLADHDPTSHAEMNAIREACSQLGTHNLSGCILYTSGEPCPMCYAACCWAHVDAIYFASTCEDAHQFGDFDDTAMFESIRLPITDRTIVATELLRDEMLQLWKTFQQDENRARY